MSEGPKSDEIEEDGHGKRGSDQDLMDLMDIDVDPKEFQNGGSGEKNRDVEDSENEEENSEVYLQPGKVVEDAKSEPQIKAKFDDQTEKTKA